MIYLVVTQGPTLLGATFTKNIHDNSSQSFETNNLNVFQDVLTLNSH